MSKYVVPNGMLAAAGYVWIKNDATCVKKILEAAIDWQDKQLTALLKKRNTSEDFYRSPSLADSYQNNGWNFAIQAVRRMFHAPEPAVTETDICEIGAVLRDRKIRISNAEVGEILKAARSNRPAEPEEPLTFNGIPVRIDPSMNPNEPPRWENNPDLEMIGNERLIDFCGRYRTIGEAVTEAYHRGLAAKERA